MQIGVIHPIDVWNTSLAWGYPNQGEQIWRISAYWVRVFFRVVGRYNLKLQKWKDFELHFPRQGSCFDTFVKKRVGLHFGPFSSSGQLDPNSS
jgi:hypothetical protein